MHFHLKDDAANAVPKRSSLFPYNGAVSNSSMPNFNASCAIAGLYPLVSHKCTLVP